ncbi:MAG: hypothetical protein DRJ66_01915 [Thermoprotei archaeon]|nr:MAG: hypothetical protein DRJ66_01915 [Thermoprotei archaeon]RLF20247.1 MAG: hypothetical protein DRZ82_02795 [Thermoprotei archaeon]
MSHNECDVIGCNNPAYKTISATELAKVNVSFKVSSNRGRIHLCKEHYKEFKKALRNIKKFERWRIGSIYLL